MQETQILSLGLEYLLEKEMATHSSVLSWKIPWTESLSGYIPLGHKELDMTEHACGEGNGTPLQYFCLENPVDGGAW